jgi:hypothetical protein
MIFWWQVFSILQKNSFKKQYYVINSTFKKIVKKQKKKSKFSQKNHHNCLQYEMVLKILYCHVLNIAKFG